MNKKIKTLVQKYEKDMQFENRFDELKDKLDLIPDADIKSEVFTIKRKVMPAYMMMIVLLMLITGIIGLQFGLNTSYVTGPEQVDKIEELLSDVAEIYDRESIESIIIDSNTKVQIYIGIKNNQKVLMFIGLSEVPQTEISIVYNTQSVTITKSNLIRHIVILDDTSIEIDFVVNYSSGQFSNHSITRDYAQYFDFLGY